MSRLFLGLVVAAALALAGFGASVAAQPPGGFCDKRPNHPKCETTSTTTTTTPPAAKVIHVFVVVPSVYTSNVTVAQAEAATRLWLGQPGDAACLGHAGCSIEGWFKHELGLYFDYDLTVHRSAWTATQINAPYPLDSCGQMNELGVWGNVPSLLYQERGYDRGGQKTMVLLVGAGGWAGHHPDSATAIVGDWGVAEQNGYPGVCDPYGTVFPSRGFGHEFVGMLGAFVNDAYYPVFTGDPLDAQHEANLLARSGDWLHP